MIRIPIVEPYFDKDELHYVSDCIRSGWISSAGKYVQMFGDEFARYCDVRCGVPVSTGTAALHLALVVLDIGLGDEVIVPDLTFVATANAVVYCGARPVFVDIDKNTWNIDPSKIEVKITKKTKAIVPVHLYGHPADMDPILKLAKKHNLYVIEDAAEAHGAEYKGKKVGGFGDIACFSFFGNKTITTGEGGMLITNNKEWAKRAKYLRDQAKSPKRKYWHANIGYNYGLTNLQAGVGLAQLKKLDGFIEKKRQIASWYNNLLKNINGITLPPEKSWAKNSYWMYSILVEKKFGSSRNHLMEKLKERGIETRPFFYPIHSMPPYRKLATGNYPNTINIARKGLNLPSSVTLKVKDIVHIVSVIEAVSK